MHLKSVQEFHQDFVFSFLTSFNIWVHLGIVCLFDVVNVEDTTLVFVHNGEGLFAEVNSELIHFSSNSSQEFFVVNGARSISIKDVEEATSIFVFKTNSEVSTGFLEFICVQILRVVIISNLELFSKTNKSSGSSAS